MTFVSEWIAGRAHVSDIDDWVDRWHTSQAYGGSLHAFLGFSREEYGRWLQYPQTIYSILEACKRRSIDEAF